MSCYKLHFHFTHCCLSTMNQTVKIHFELRNVFEIINFTSHLHRVEKGKKLAKQIATHKECTYPVSYHQRCTPFILVKPLSHHSKHGHVNPLQVAVKNLSWLSGGSNLRL